MYSKTKEIQKKKKLFVEFMEKIKAKDSFQLNKDEVKTNDFVYFVLSKK
jgi:hypothetical protein